MVEILERSSVVLEFECPREMTKKEMELIKGQGNRLESGGEKHPLRGEDRSREGFKGTLVEEAWEDRGVCIPQPDPFLWSKNEQSGTVWQ